LWCLLLLVLVLLVLVLELLLAPLAPCKTLLVSSEKAQTFMSTRACSEAWSKSLQRSMITTPNKLPPCAAGCGGCWKGWGRAAGGGGYGKGCLLRSLVSECVAHGLLQAYG
jgi:hypothetical protein